MLQLLQLQRMHSSRDKAREKIYFAKRSPELPCSIALWCAFAIAGNPLLSLR
jgi:hypothetical protein